MTPGGPYITCAAVWFQDGKAYPHQGAVLGLIVAGHRHHDCYEMARSIWPDGFRDIPHVQGFLVAGPRTQFVTRSEALRIATQAGQLVGRRKHYPLDELDSSDLY